MFGLVFVSGRKQVLVLLGSLSLMCSARLNEPGFVVVLGF